MEMASRILIPAFGRDVSSSKSKNMDSNWEDKGAGLELYQMTNARDVVPGRGRRQVDVGDFGCRVASRQSAD